MKIGIYDKWLNTLGGGEKVASSMAEIFSKNGHEVYLIGNAEINKEEIENKMAVDLSKVNVVTWFERSCDKLSLQTKNFDVFINVSFLDHLPSKAKKSFYYIHFPTPVKKGISSFIKYGLILPFLRKFLIIPSVQLGIENLDDVYYRGGKWLSSTNNISFLNTPQNFLINFRIFSEQIRTTSLENVTFSSPNCELELIDSYIDHSTNVLAYKFRIRLKKNESPQIKINLSEEAKNQSLGLVSMTVFHFRYFLWNYFKKYFPRHEMALYGSSSYKPESNLDNYQTLIANSEFTKKWTKYYWKKDSIVIYPPVDVDKFKPGKKRNIIVNVGRFFVGGHSKRQDVLVRAFREMVDKKLLDNTWELHLLGGAAVGNEHEKFIRHIKEKAKGYKIFFHFSPPFSELRKIVSEAKIYWHATGYGLKENKVPIQFEHFGISVVEGMAAGAVPIVYNGGGLPEIVNSKVGRVWKTIKGLKRNTYKIINNKDLMKELSLSAQKSSKNFSKERFGKEIMKLLEEKK